MPRLGRTRPLTYANVVATLALVLATGGTAAAAVLITSNSQIAPNTISGHQPPSGKHSNLLTGSVNATDLASSVKSAFKAHCPAGLQQGADLCFDVSPRTSTDWLSALSTCANAGLRLPSVAELTEVFDHSGAPQPYEWTDGLLQNGSTLQAPILSNDSSRAIALALENITVADGQPELYRCVVNATN